MRPDRPRPSPRRLTTERPAACPIGRMRHVRRMRFPHGHLAYCTNIHPGEDWEGTFAAISTHTMRVRELVAAARSEDGPFAIGLRLSAKAAAELRSGDHLPRFKD